MNYEVFCFGDREDGSIGIVNKEYFKYYQDALRFQRHNQDLYDTISITPMNEYAETVMSEYGD